MIKKNTWLIAWCALLFCGGGVAYGQSDIRHPSVQYNAQQASPQQREQVLQQSRSRQEQTIPEGHVVATPETMEQSFVQFKRHFPLMPGSFNLTGYETQKVSRSYVILSPNRQDMVFSEAIFMPHIRQTYSRVLLAPVGEEPQIQDVIPPERYEKMEKKRIKEQAKNPDYQPTVRLEDIDPFAFWWRYQPDHQMTHRQVLTQVGLKRVKPYWVDLMQVVDWSLDGDTILMIYRPGYHHLGILKTIPVIYDHTTRDITHYTMVPGLVWQDAQRLFPEFKDNAILWDIRPLGWNSKASDDIVIKLVVFNGNSEVASGFWNYGSTSGNLEYLGPSIEPDVIAGNGWLVTFTDPANPQGNQTYGPGQKTPTRAQREAQKKK